jgi:hypothetical protein
VFSATFSIILSYIVAVSFIDGAETGGPGENKSPTCRKSLTNVISKNVTD